MVWKQALCIFLLLHARGDGKLAKSNISLKVVSAVNYIASYYFSS